jgi:hypothetical protein
MRVPSVISVAKTPEEEGFYFRVGHNDHAGLNHLIAERKLRADGLVLDARRHQRHATLRQHAQRALVATCLDTQAMELAMPGTSSKGHAELPWAGAHPHALEDFSPQYIERFVNTIVERVVDGSYSAVMAPTHYMGEDGGAWLDIDGQLTRALRVKLDAADKKAIRITYPLAVHHKAFYDASARASLQRALAGLPIDVVSLRIHPFGSDSGPLVTRNFIEACWGFRRPGVPMMIERAGFAGLSAFALGAVDLVESGITMGDSFDVGRLQKPRRTSKASRFSLPPRVYMEALGTTVERKIAVKLMDSPRGKLHFACKDPTCCPNGFRGMLENPQRHSALARQRQYAELSRVPRTMRAEHFLQNVVTPVCDMLSRAGDSHEPFKAAHRRMLSMKETLLDLQREQKKLHDDRRLAPDSGLPARPVAQVITLSPRDSRGR